MNTIVYARCVLAVDAGARVVPENVPHGAGITVYTSHDLGNEQTLPPPFQSIPVLPERAAYRGQIIAVVTGPDWHTVDRSVALVDQSVDTAAVFAQSENRSAVTMENESPLDATTEQKEADVDAYEIVEGVYRTGLQLHMPDAAMWSEAAPTAKGVHVTLPCQWPAHVRASVAASLELPVRAVHVTCHTPSGNRDAAIVLPSILAVLSALVTRATKQTVRVALRNDQAFLSGGRAPARVQWSSRITDRGTLLSNTVAATLNLGAYPILLEESDRRLQTSATLVYRTGPVSLERTFETTPDIPMGPFEGVASAQLSFTREVHWNRLAEIAQEDPIHWRKRHVKREWPILNDICDTLATEADFHRRYGANELIRKRRVQLPRDSAALRGIGCAIGEQQSGMTANRETGAVTVRLNQDGTADLHCSVPTPTRRLHLAWRQIVAQELAIERDAVRIETGYDSNHHDSGPRLFSRGVTLVPRAISSACQAIQKQRFREPLPITVRRTMRGGRGTRTPVDALRSIGAAAVETVLLPASMEIDIRSVTMVIYAGRVLDRGMAEAELRRGIYHALNWTLHESLVDAELVSEPETLRGYNTAFRGAVPRIKIVFLNQIRRDGPVGIGELPFNTVPAALVSALSQATGVYLDSLPVKPAHLLRLLQED